MRLRGDLQVSREINSRRSNEALSAEVLAADRALDRYEAAWLSLDAGIADRDVELPDATTLPEGWKVVIHNSGAANDLLVRSFDGLFGGALLKTIESPAAINDTRAYQFILIDNATAAGVWFVVELGEPSQVVAVKSVATFVIADWPAAVSGKRTLTSTQIAGLGVASHGRGSNPVYIVQELAGSDWDRVLVDRERMDASGNLSLTVTSADSFDGRVVLV